MTTDRRESVTDSIITSFLYGIGGRIAFLVLVRIVWLLFLGLVPYDIVYKGVRAVLTACLFFFGGFFIYIIFTKVFGKAFGILFSDIAKTMSGVTWDAFWTEFWGMFI